MKRDSDAWALLQSIGAPQQIRPTNGKAPYALDQRNCTCGSTLARKVAP